MNDTNFKLLLNYITEEYTSEEHCAEFNSLDDALEEADDVAFENVGFPLESWQSVDFGDGNLLYFFYPNEEDRTTKYKLTILEEI